MQVTTTVIVEIKGTTHTLTKAEAQQLLHALQSALGPVHQYQPIGPSIFDKDKYRFQDQLLRNDYVVTCKAQ